MNVNCTCSPLLYISVAYGTMLPLCMPHHIIITHTCSEIWVHAWCGWFNCVATTARGAWCYSVRRAWASATPSYSAATVWCSCVKTVSSPSTATATPPLSRHRRHRSRRATHAQVTQHTPSPPSPSNCQYARHRVVSLSRASVLAVCFDLERFSISFPSSAFC